jgi:hypothetical protein
LSEGSAYTEDDIRILCKRLQEHADPDNDQVTIEDLEAYWGASEHGVRVVHCAKGVLCLSVVHYTLGIMNIFMIRTYNLHTYRGGSHSPGSIHGLCFWWPKTEKKGKSRIFSSVEEYQVR